MADSKYYRLKEVNGFRSKRDYYAASNVWGIEHFQSRNDPPKPPIYKILLETENHYATIELRLKDELINPEGLKRLSEELKTLFGYEVEYIRRTDEKGLTEYIYRRDKSKPLPLDSDFDRRLKMIFNARDLISIVHSNNVYAKYPGGPTEWEKRTKQFLFRNFLDSLGRPLSWSFEHSISQEHKKWYLKNKQHSIYNTPHKDSQNSPIEELLEKALTKLQIPFKKQAEIFFEEKLFSIPDFLIEKPLMAIYCDGIEFHKDPQKIIRDKQQDRVLQRNGYMVYRFSGSEIHSNAAGCAAEISLTIEMLMKRDT